MIRFICSGIAAISAASVVCCTEVPVQPADATVFPDSSVLIDAARLRAYGTQSIEVDEALSVAADSAAVYTVRTSKVIGRDTGIARIDRDGHLRTVRTGQTWFVWPAGSLFDSARIVVVPRPRSLPRNSASTAELPRVYLDTMLAAARAAVPTRTVTVSTSAQLQAAIDAAEFGDAIVLQAGATFVGPFTLRNKTSGSGWITIQGAGTIPSPGVRARPTTSVGWPKIVSNHQASAAIQTELGAHHYRLTGIEVTAQAGFTSGYSMMSLGDGTSAQNTVAKMAHHLVLDRVYVHGTPSYNFQRCIQLNSASTAIVDSWISDCHGKGFDSQAIGGWNGAGPYHIVNNYLEGAGENVMFGGAGPSIPGQIPSDITFKLNHVYKPPAWKGVWTIKNLFELKLGIRVLVEANVMENNWVDAQGGFAILMNSTNDQQNAPWSETRDVTFRSNIVRNVAHGVNMAGAPNPGVVVPMSKVYIGQNSFEKIGDGSFPGGILWQVGGVDNLTFEQNTGYGRTHGLVLYGARKSAGLTIQDNAFGSLTQLYGTWNYAVASADGGGYGTSALDRHATLWTFRRNVLPAGVQSAVFPAGNSYANAAGSAGANKSNLTHATSSVVVQP